jgi:choline transporter-like protein 2/4/5
MGCCGGKSKQKAIGSIAKKRWPTDILFLILFIVSFGVLAAIMQMALTAGADPMKILRGTDINGNVCGVSEAVKNKPFAVWPYPLQYNIMICAETCNYTNLCSSSSMSWRYESQPFMGAYCIPKPENETIALALAAGGEASSLSVFDSASEIFSRIVGDMYSAYMYVLISPFVAIIVTFIFMLFLRRFAGVLTFLFLLLIEIAWLALAASLYMYSSSGVASGFLTESQGTYMIYTSYVFFALNAIFLLVLLVLRKQILMAIGVVKESAEAIGDMKLIIFFPIWPVLCLLGYFCFWIVIALYLASVTEMTAGVPLPDSVKSYSLGFHTCQNLIQKALAGGITNPLAIPNDLASVTDTVIQTRDQQWKYAFAYHFFHLLWVIQFFFYFGYLVFAGATADWYFTPRDASGNKKRGEGEGELTRFPILSAVKRTFIYHLGTVCVCALIIAIVQFIRYTIMYLERQTKGDPPNKLQKILFGILKCYLRCLECCLDKLNKNALIWTAIWGDGFFTAACAAFMLIWRNLARVAAINVVSGILLQISKLAVAALNTTLFAIIIVYYEPIASKLSSPVGPVFIIFVVSWGVATVFMSVFHSIIDTVFLCFLVDAETNPAGQMLASVSLQKLVGKFQKESEKHAEDLKAHRLNRPGNDVETSSVNKVEVKPLQQAE